MTSLVFRLILKMIVRCWLNRNVASTIHNSIQLSISLWLPLFNHAINHFELRIEHVQSNLDQSHTKRRKRCFYYFTSTAPLLISLARNDQRESTSV